ncbi:serine/threonine-protein kinase [Actinomadura rupiterrae]|uniref:serine/threonine-protein kinase n=1 Tax=Actinomadura rupiterrae TaxID=559627 RepID=UPI0020A61811|nr:serine/threonine-protein kinase [Actinomadura rupiterrae]MCP2341957.1 serine/threonine protein kinase [Actinomadura rupiterrae]
MPSPLRPDDPGRLGAYRLTARLGQGGMGTVLLGEDASGRRVAVKVVNPELAGDEAFRARFRREVTAARRVSRFCTAPVLDAELEQDPLYVVTEFVDGPTLEAAVRDGGPLRGGDLEGLAVGVATALSAIHAAGIVHRDLKPANVLLSPTGPRVIDFGIARALEAADGPTVTGQFLGTPAYIAPELMRDGPLTPAADVFAWGCVVAFAATGRPPFAGRNVHETLYRVTHEPPVLDGLDGLDDTALRPLVEAALAKSPDDRPAVPDLLTSLISGPPAAALAVAAGAPALPPPAPSPEPSVQPSKTIAEPAPPSASSDEETGASAGEAAASVEKPAGARSRARRSGIRRRVVVSAVLAVLVLGGLSAWRVLSQAGDPRVPRLGAALVPDGTLADKSSGWDEDECGTYAGQHFEIQGDQEGPGYCTVPNESPVSHFVASARVRLAFASKNGLWQAGLMLLGTDDWQYAVMLRSDGSARLVKETKDGAVKVLDTVPARSYNAGAQSVRVQAEVHVTSARTTIRAWLDGDYALEADDDDHPLTKGQTGLIADALKNAPGKDDVVEAWFSSFTLNRVR